jgi:hypothetical protein
MSKAKISAPAVSLGAVTPEVSPVVETPKAPRRPIGLGYPHAKKLVNPQHTLELKKVAVAKAGGTMVWAKKAWAIKNAAGQEFLIASRDLAANTVDSLLARIVLPEVQAA